MSKDLVPVYSKLHTKSTNNWFRSRHSKNVPNLYLYYPEEIKKRQQMKEIFKNFDSDGNGMLELDEFLDMFVGTYIHSEQVQEGSQMAL